MTKADFEKGKTLAREISDPLTVETFGRACNLSDYALNIMGKLASVYRQCMTFLRPPCVEDP